MLARRSHCPARLALRFREKAWLAGCTWRAAHYPLTVMHVQRAAPGRRRITRFNRDARAAASRFAGPNSQDSPSLDEKDSGSLMRRQRSMGDATLPAESTWRQDVRDQHWTCTLLRRVRTTCRVPPPRGQQARATPHRPLREISDLLLKCELILYRRDFRHLVVFETPNGKVSDLHRLAGILAAPICTAMPSAPNMSCYDFIVS